MRKVGQEGLTKDRDGAGRRKRTRLVLSRAPGRFHYSAIAFRVADVFLLISPLRRVSFHSVSRRTVQRLHRFLYRLPYRCRVSYGRHLSHPAAFPPPTSLFSLCRRRRHFGLSIFTVTIVRISLPAVSFTRHRLHPPLYTPSRRRPRFITFTVPSSVNPR